MAGEIPKLNSARTRDPDQRLIYRRYYSVSDEAKDGRPLHVYNWLLAEFDRPNRIGYGWISLDDLQNAKWDLFSTKEISQKGAIIDVQWEVLPFSQAKALCYGYLQPMGSDTHYESWFHNNQHLLNQSHGLWVKGGTSLRDFSKSIYDLKFSQYGSFR